jgi:cytoskeleton protein RodZ
MRVGSELKAARKKAGLTVEVIAKRTKIGVGKLVALEKDDFKNLPTGLYLFSVVRAYAREVRVDPEPLVDRLRAAFADKDALDALQALNATGGLDAKNQASVRRFRNERSSRLRNAAIAAVVVMAAAGSGAYLHNMTRLAQDVRVARIERPTAPQAVSPAVETRTTALSSPAPSATVQIVNAVQESAPVTTPKPKRRTVAVMSAPEAAVEAFEGIADKPDSVDEPRSDDPGTTPIAP